MTDPNFIAWLGSEMDRAERIVAEAKAYKAAVEKALKTSSALDAVLAIPQAPTPGDSSTAPSEPAAAKRAALRPKLMTPIEMDEMFGGLTGSIVSARVRVCAEQVRLARLVDRYDLAAAGCPLTPEQEKALMGRGGC